MLFDALKLMYDLLYNAHSVQFSLLRVNKPWGNCGFVLFKESNVRRLGGCFIDTTAYVSLNISLIYLDFASAKASDLTVLDIKVWIIC